MRTHAHSLLARVLVVAAACVLLAMPPATASAVPPPPGTIHGTLSLHGTLTSGSTVQVFGRDGSGWTSVAVLSTLNDGTWSCSVAPGEYKVELSAFNSTWAERVWWSSTGISAFQSSGETVTIAPASTATCDATLPLAACLGGTIRKHANGGPLSDIDAVVYGFDPVTSAWEEVGYGTSQTDGTYQTNGLIEGGPYRLAFIDRTTSSYVSQYWPRRSRLASAADLTLAAPRLSGGYDATMSVDVQPESVAGSNRVGTSIAASQRLYPDGSSPGAVIITTGWNWPDALGGAALAAAVRAPLLLTSAAPASMPASLVAEVDRLHRLGATEAYVLGSDKAVGSAVATQLASVFGASNVHRLGGATRYETSAIVASATLAVAGSPDGTCFIARGTNYADALAASPVSYELGRPILLAEPDGHGGLSDAMTKFVKNHHFTHAVILGSVDAVSFGVQDDLEAALGGKAFVDRWWGYTRVDTALEIAKHATGSGFAMVWDGAGFANGYTYPDALCGGPLLGSDNTVLLLTPNDPKLTGPLAGQLRTLAAQAAIQRLRFLGGKPEPLGDPVRNAIIAKLQ